MSFSRAMGFGHNGSCLNNLSVLRTIRVAPSGMGNICIHNGPVIELSACRLICVTFCNYCAINMTGITAPPFLIVKVASSFTCCHLLALAQFGIITRLSLLVVLSKHWFIHGQVFLVFSALVANYFSVV